MFKCIVLICFAVLALHSSPTSGALTWSRRFAQLDNENSAIVEVPASNKLEAIEDGPIEEEEEEEDKNELDEADSDSENLDLEDTDSVDDDEEDDDEEDSDSEDAGEEDSESEDAGEEDAGEEDSESEDADEEDSEPEDAGEEDSDAKEDVEVDDDELFEELKGLKGEDLSKKLSEMYDEVAESLLENLDISYKPILEKILEENADRKWTSLDEFADFWLSTYLEIEELHDKIESTIETHLN